MLKKKKTNIDLIQSAFSLFTENKPEAALNICKNILRKNSKDINALNLTAIIKDKLGDKEDAILFFKKAVFLNPNNTDILTNIGITYFELGKLDDADKYLNKALEIDSNIVDAVFNLANISLTKNDNENAVLLYEKTIYLDPHNIKSYNNLGLIFHQSGNLDKAEKNYRSALSINPDFIESLTGLTFVLFDLKKTKESLKYGIKSLEFQPENEDILIYLSHIHISEEEFEKAKPYLSKVIEINKRAEGNSLNSALLLRESTSLPDKKSTKSLVFGEVGKDCLSNGDFEDAECYLTASLSENPNNEGILNSLGILYQEQRRYDEARHALKKSLSLDPNYIPALSNIGNIYLELQDLKNAKKYFDQAYKLDPKNTQSQINSCILALTMQDYENGWKFYRSRKSVKLNGADSPPDSLPLSIKNKKILIIRDQGIGDELFFLRFIKKLKMLGPHISYVTDPKLMPVLSSLGLIDTLLTEIPEKKNFDLSISIGDIAYLLQHKSSMDTPPPLDLTPAIDPTETKKVEKILSEFGPPPYIAVTWKAGSMISHKRIDAYLKDIDIGLIAKIIKNIPGTVIAIQKDVPKKDFSFLSEQIGRPILDASVYHNDLPKMLSLLNIIDKYITVSNTNVHLREGLGKKTHCLICSPPEWRWLEKGKHSHWFPNSFIYRQQADRSWDNAIAEIISDLTKS